MSFENLKSSRKKMTLSNEDVSTGVVQKHSKKKIILINHVRLIQVIGTLETQFLIVSSHFGLLTGLAVERIG